MLTLLYVLLAMVCFYVLALAAWRVGHRFQLSFFPFWVINWIYTTFVWKTTVNRPLPISPGQGAVIIANHRAPLDPAVLTTASWRRQIFWMVAKEYFSNPVLGWMLRSLGCIPVSRGGVDTAATKQVIRLARGGKLVGMFPEGRINTTEALLLPGRPGAALVALKAGVPVIPCFIKGAPYDGTSLGCLMMRAKVTVTVGEPIDMAPYVTRYKEGADRELLEEVTRRFLQEMAALAGEPEFEPKIAGRNWRRGSEADDGSPAAELA